MTPNIEPGYRIIEPIASGGMGQVFKAEHVITKRIEAIKILTGAGTDEETDRFLREIQLQASLSHPNIAAVYNAFQYDGNLVMAMELVQGEPLRAVLQRGALPIDLALRYAGEVLDAIGYAHAHGVIHRDITPSNIVVTPDGSIKLMDFGLAKGVALPSASQSGIYLGSPHYMSPEQVKDATRASARSDIYSLGAVLYEMVTGRKVFESDSSFILMQAQVESAPVPPIQVNPAIPPWLNAAILTALEKDPARRFADAAAFRRALESPLPSILPAAMVPPAPPAKASRQRPAWLVPALQFSVTCAVILLPTVFYAHSRHSTDVKKPAAPAVAPIAPATPAEHVTPPPPEVHATRVQPPVARPSPKRIPRRTAKVDLTPMVIGNEAPPAPQPAAAFVPAPSKLAVPEPAVTAAPDRSAPEPPAAATASAEVPTAEAVHEEQTDAPKEKKTHGKFRRTLGKIFSPFAK